MSDLKENYEGLAHYNKVMNEKVMNECIQLSPDDLNADQGAFFKSILGTMQHILVADLLWLRRFSMLESQSSMRDSFSVFPEITSLRQRPYADFNDFQESRLALDQLIVEFIKYIPEVSFSEEFSFQSLSDEKITKPLWVCLTHFFNHQTHHRGQITTLLFQSGRDIGQTDFPYL